MKPPCGLQAPPFLEILSRNWLQTKFGARNERRRELCLTEGRIYQTQGTGLGFQPHVFVIDKHSQDTCRKRNPSPVSAG
jgi:hypothetical protein